MRDARLGFEQSVTTQQPLSPRLQRRFRCEIAAHAVHSGHRRRRGEAKIGPLERIGVTPRNASADMLCQDVLFPALRRRKSELVLGVGYVSSSNNRELPVAGSAGIGPGMTLGQTYANPG